MNRNPNKRLGAGPLDAEEVKRHPWFTGINWDDALLRKLTPPKPTLKKLIAASDVIPPAFEQKPNDPGICKIDGWSFATLEK